MPIQYSVVIVLMNEIMLTFSWHYLQAAHIVADFIFHVMYFFILREFNLQTTILSNNRFVDITLYFTLEFK